MSPAPLSLDASSNAFASDLILRAGATKVDITPNFGVSLDGPISKNGPVTGVNDRLHARALVFDDGETRLAIVVCDACMIGRDVLDAAKEQVTAKTGLPASRMQISATHSHAVPRATHIGTGPLDDEYHEQPQDEGSRCVATDQCFWPRRSQQSAPRGWCRRVSKEQVAL